MKVLLCLLGLAVSVPAYAGHGTIEETDECFIVQWSGDASDKAADTSSKAQPTRTVAPVKQQTAAIADRIEARKRDAGVPQGDESATKRSRRRRAAGDETANP